MLLSRFQYKTPDRSKEAEFNKWRPFIQLRVQNVLIYWIDEHFYYFEKDSELRERFEEALLAADSIGTGKRGVILKDIYLNMVTSKNSFLMDKASWSAMMRNKAA